MFADTRTCADLESMFLVWFGLQVLFSQTRSVPSKGALVWPRECGWIGKYVFGLVCKCYSVKLGQSQVKVHWSGQGNVGGLESMCLVWSASVIQSN